MNLKVASITDPPEPPTSNPSFLIKLLAYRKDGRSSVLTQKSTNFLSQVLGTKSYPIP
jgi:hypothetical protein